MSQAREAILTFLAFAALCALGHGSMVINSTLLTAQWFVRRHGRAMAQHADGQDATVSSTVGMSAAAISKRSPAGA